MYVYQYVCIYFDSEWNLILDTTRNIFLPCFALSSQLRELALNLLLSLCSSSHFAQKSLSHLHSHRNRIQKKKQQYCYLLVFDFFRRMSHICYHQHPEVLKNPPQFVSHSTRGHTHFPSLNNDWLSAIFVNWVRITSFGKRTHGPTTTSFSGKTTFHHLRQWWCFFSFESGVCLSHFGSNDVTRRGTIWLLIWVISGHKVQYVRRMFSSALAAVWRGSRSVCAYRNVDWLLA